MISVASGADALRKLQDTRPDVIFMDYMMPEMDGLEACQAIARNSATSEIPVIMTTSNDTPEFRKRGVASGARGFLSKGLEDRELDNVLDTIARPGPAAPQPRREPAMASTRAELDEQTLAMIRDQAINAARRASEEYFTGQLPGLEEQVIQVAEAAARKAVAGATASGASTGASADAEQLAVLQRRVDNLYNDKQLRAAVQKMVREEGVASGGARPRRRVERSPSGFGRFLRNVVILGVLLVAAYFVIVLAFPETPLAESLRGMVDSAVRRLTAGS